MPFPDPPVTARDFARIACTCMDCDIGNSCSFADSGEDAVKGALRALRVARREMNGAEFEAMIDEILGE